MTETEIELARALYRALAKVGEEECYVAADFGAYEAKLDGRFDLRAVAVELLQAGWYKREAA
jgi:hypothetical protein